jgi:hypothetical protein
MSVAIRNWLKSPTGTSSTRARPGCPRLACLRTRLFAHSPVLTRRRVRTCAWSRPDDDALLGSGGELGVCRGGARGQSEAGRADLTQHDGGHVHLQSAVHAVCVGHPAAELHIVRMSLVERSSAAEPDAAVRDVEERQRRRGGGCGCGCRWRDAPGAGICGERGGSAEMTFCYHHRYMCCIVKLLFPTRSMLVQARPGSSRLVQARPGSSRLVHSPSTLLVHDSTTTPLR